MAKRMLVDATHPEETRVVVVNGNRLEELDFEIASRKQLKGNIYLAKVIRVEPSLQAAFVEYGGNRHGFLAFSEIHPDYYRIPVADREALLREQARAYEDDRDDEHDAVPTDSYAGHAAYETPVPTAVDETGGQTLDGGNGTVPVAAEADDTRFAYGDVDGETSDAATSAGEAADGDVSDTDSDGAVDDAGPEGVSPLAEAGSDPSTQGEPGDGGGFEIKHSAGRRSRGRRPPRAKAMAADGGDMIEEEIEEPRQEPRRRPLRSYKIQEVIKRRQILLVQVTKEERGNKGAALTTFLSLPGRYCVLMPNTPRGGGISRKITNPADRKRMKELLEGLDVPHGMSVILRTAGIERTKQEVKRDLEYLMRLWDSIRELTLQSVAPALIYEEANLIKRSIRDLYSNDMDDVLVEGEVGFRTAKDFMRMLMPSHARKIQNYKDESIPLFHRFQVEGAIESMFNPVVQLRSGGYIVINPTEALVAIDVNSGRSTKERNIEETALRTNLEAADEVARQLRLRDLAGLIVIDFIDMEDPRNNAAVEKRLKEAMKADRARIQLGRISPFGLLELSRQRLRPSLLEINFERCPHCEGTGLIRSTESAALAVLRAIEEEGIRRRSSEVLVTANPAIALYILNQKRDMLTDIERRYGFRVFLAADDNLNTAAHRLERMRNRLPGEEVAAIPMVSSERVFAETDRALEAAEPEPEEVEVEEAAAEAEPVAEATEERQDGDRDGRRRRRRRRRRGEGFEARQLPTPQTPAEVAVDGGDAETTEGEEDEDEEDGDDEALEPGADASQQDDARRKRRRGKRGGRRRRRDREENGSVEETALDSSAAVDGSGDTSAPMVTESEAAVSEDTGTEMAVDAPGEEAAAPDAPSAEPQTGPLAEAVTEASAVEPVEATETPETPAVEDAAAPKKRASRARKKAVADEVPAEAPVATEETAAPKKRAPRSRKKAAEAAAPEAEGTVTEAAVTEVREPEAAAVADLPAPDVVETAASEAPAPEAPAAEAPTTEAPAEANPYVQINPPVEKPKKGWWSRLVKE